MKNLFKALADFQQEVPVIHKATQGYGYTYADLPAIFEIINPLMQKNHLGFTQPIEGNSIRTILFHTESGESIESVTEIPTGVQLKGMNDFQVLGSAITYLRRYAISSILGLVTDKDVDAGGEQVKNEKVTPNIDKATAPVKWLSMDSPVIEKIAKKLGDGETVTMQQIRDNYKVSKVVAEKLTEIGVTA